MNLFSKIAVLTFVLVSAAATICAQSVAPPLASEYQVLSDAELDQLLGPIALYPDPLIAQILPASTFPTQIVLADRYVSGGGDANVIDQQPWDPSIQAVARYPSVLKWLDDNLNWTTQLGQAFLGQQSAVMSSIQRLRSLASGVGNLQSTPQQQVITDGGSIEIVPADPQVIYVPVYQPSVVYYQSEGITFGLGFAIGGWLNYDCDWRGRNLIMWDHEHPRPHNWWHEASRQRNTEHTTVWNAGNRDRKSAPKQGDRGWGARSVARPSTPTTLPRQVAQHDQRAVTAPKAAPARVQEHAAAPTAAPRAAPEAAHNTAPTAAPKAVSGGAFTGIQSAHDTKTFSDRGQQSLKAIPRSAPPARASVPSGNAGAGNNSKSDKKR